MSELVRRKVEATVHAGYALPAMLGLNTVLLFALDSSGAIPQWLRVAATLFLQF